MVKGYRGLLLAGVVLCAAQSVVWGDCLTDTPLLTSAASQVLDRNSTAPVTITISARDLPAGCTATPEQISFATPFGLPSAGVAGLTFEPPLSFKGPLAGVKVTLTPSMIPSGTYNVVYTVKDAVNNTTSVTLPLVVASAPLYAATPSLDPVSDVVVFLGQRLSFAVGLSDPDGDLNITDQNTLAIDGLPVSSTKTYAKLTASRFEVLVTLAPSPFATLERGTYRVNITGRKIHGGYVTAQMRIIVQ